MSLSADSIIDRIKLKEQIVRWRAGTILLAVLLALLLISKTSSGVDAIVGRGYIASVTVEGLIQQDADRDKILKGLGDNKNVKAIIVNVNSPGGTMVGSELLYKRLRSISTKKPVVAVMQEVAASGGYMTAIAANHVLAQDGTLTGSIGVLLQSAEFTGMAEKVGVSLKTFKSSPLKGSPSPLEKLTPEVQQAMDKLIKANYDIFVNIVADARSMQKEDVMLLADGRVYTGSQAAENQLIDGIGGQDEALVWLEKKDQTLKQLPVRDVKLYREKKGLENLLTSMIGWKKSPFAMEGISLSGVLALWQL